jgi:hypothetical protein
MYKLEMQITGGGVVSIETFETKKIIRMLLIVEALEEMNWDIGEKASIPSAPTKRRGRHPGVKNRKVKQ